VARNQLGLLSARAALAEVEEAALRYDEAAARWDAYGHQLEHARALLGAGRCLLTLDRPGGRHRFKDAQAILSTLKAEPLLDEIDTALGNPTTPRYNQRR
jgi:hypothetical protein